MNYDDIETGEVVTEKTYPDIDESGMKIVSALMRDPNPIHYDRRLVEDRGYPGLVNQGPINVSYITQTVLSILDTPRDMLSLRVRFEEMVFENDTVTVRVEVEDKSATPDGKRVDLALTLEKDDGTVGATGVATVRLS